MMITAVAMVAVSCVHTVSRAVIAPPHIAGANFVGSSSCMDCHGDLGEHFVGATHAGLKNHEGVDISCEACHGPGSIHVRTGGGLESIVNPGRAPETCFQCHADKRGEFSLAHSHSVMNGVMSCGDCHDSHSGDAMSATGPNLASIDATCVTCHEAQAGPFAFEHEGMRDGCISCHQPHGSMNDKMLISRSNNLCLQCHFQEHRGGGILIGNRDHSGFLGTGTCWTAGCHEAVHGSHTSSSLRY